MFLEHLNEFLDWLTPMSRFVLAFFGFHKAGNPGFGSP
jgi:hypothetical protein